MRRTFLLAGLLAVLAAPAFAQGGGGMGGGHMGPPKSGQGLLQGITLTADQQKKVDSIFESNAPMRAQMQAGGDSASRARMMPMRDEQMKAYRSVLTAAQQKVFDKNVAEMSGRMHGMGGPGGPPSGAGGPPPKP